MSEGGFDETKPRKDEGVPERLSIKRLWSEVNRILNEGKSEVTVAIGTSTGARTVTFFKEDSVMKWRAYRDQGGPYLTIFTDLRIDSQHATFMVLPDED